MTFYKLFFSKILRQYYKMWSMDILLATNLRIQEGEIKSKKKNDREFKGLFFPLCYNVYWRE